MYLEHHGLIDKPFSLTPDPKYFFASGCHAEARDLLRYGVREREGFMCFVGAAGTGKTTLLRTVLEGFGEEVVTALVLNPYLSEEELLELVVADFGIASPEELSGDGGRRFTKQQLIDRLNRHLLSLHMQGKTAVLVVDEAQNLPLPVLEQIRLLSNLETSKSKLMQIVLAGQLGLRELLRTPELSQLAQRVSVRYTLQPLSVAELDRYIDHRLRIAGSEGDILFDDDAVAAVHRYSEGVPRLVNLVCDRALLAGYARRTREITEEIVDAAAETLDLLEADAAPPVERPTSGRRRGRATGRPPTGRPSRAAGDGSTRSGSRGRKAAIGVAAAAMLTVGAWLLAPGPQVLRTEAPTRAEGEQRVIQRDAPRPTEPGAAPSGDAARTAREPLPQGAFTVYLSSFRRPDEDQVVDLRERLEDRGYASFLVAADVPGQGRLHRLTVGEFADESAARRVANALRAELGVAHAEVVAIADVVES